MASGPRYVVKFRRRRENKTNYHKRLTLLKSKKTRLIVRRSNNYIICQLVKYNPKGDTVIKAVNSKALKKHGWSGNFKNIAAAYLTGLLLAKTSKEKEAILDSGLYTMTKGSKIYSAVKGAIDGGLNINCAEDNFPKEEKLVSGKWADQFKKTKDAIMKLSGEEK